MLWFKFLYDRDIDIATATCALKGLAAVKLNVDVSEQLRPWLERWVLACGPELLVPPESPPTLVLFWRIWRTRCPQAHNWQFVPLRHGVDQVWIRGLEG